VPPADPTLRAWWPTTQALDLIEAPAEAAARLVHGILEGFPIPRPVTLAPRDCADLAAAFAPAATFHTVPSRLLLLPTRSRWTVLWTDCFLCGGEESLCALLTGRHRLTTLHWTAHDAWTTTQSGALFLHRRHDGTGVVERSVHAGEEDGRWTFLALGEPLPEEDLPGYAARRIRDRLNERRMMELLARLDARPWEAGFYALPGTAWEVRRPVPPPIEARPRDAVLLPPA
jgi:hypothetical protein